MTDDLLARLAAPFPPEIVSWRVGPMTKDKTRGMALAYVDARDVQDRLNQVCGVWWQVRHHSCEGQRLACDIGVKVGEEWVWRGDGAGSTDLESEKGAFSDSFKRAAVRWGIGRYLYDTDSPWVSVEKRGESYVIPEGEMGRLRALLGRKSGTQASARPEPTGAGPAPHAPAIVEDDSARNEAHAHYKRIRHALLEVLKTPIQIDGLIKVEGGSYDLRLPPTGNLGVIHSVSPEAYRQIITEANARKMEMRGGTP